MNIEQLYSAGDLQGLHRAAAAQVAAAPTDAAARALFVQVLCMECEWDRAAQQADALLKLNPASAMFCTTLTGLIAAEKQRESYFAGQSRPDWVGAPPAYAEKLAQAVAAFAAGDAASGASACMEVLDVLPNTGVTLTDGARREWLLDGDVRLSGVLECICDGQYKLVDQAQVQSVEIAPPTHPVEVVWPHVRLRFRGGEVVVGRMPGRYPHGGESDGKLLMAKETEWQECADGLYTGRGQRCWDSDDGLHPIFTEKTLKFDS